MNTFVYKAFANQSLNGLYKLYQLKGISCYVKPLIDGGKKIDKALVKFVENSLFTTLTNVNFDPEVYVKLLKESQAIKESLRKEESAGVYPAAADKRHIKAK